jgi:hypothetical protein
VLDMTPEPNFTENKEKAVTGGLWSNTAFVDE